MADVPRHHGVILFAAFMTKLLGPGLSYVAGVYHVALVEEFENVTLVAWLGSLFAGMFALTGCFYIRYCFYPTDDISIGSYFGPLGSFVINTSDCRTCVVLSGILGMIGFGASFFIHDINLLFLSYALIAGLGTGFAESGCMVIIGYYFPEKSRLVSGIITCGAGLGIVLHPLFIQYLICEYGLRGALLLNGGIMLNLCVCGMLMRPSPFERERKRVVRISSSFKSTAGTLAQVCRQFPETLKNVSFSLFAFSTFLFAMGISTLYLYLLDYFHTQGASMIESSLAISASGIGSIVSRILLGLAANDKSIGPDIFYTYLPSFTGLITLLLPLLSHTSQGRIAYGALVGLYSGACLALFAPVVLEILGVKHYASGFGIVSLCSGIGILVGPPTAGVIFKSSGHYYSVFIFSAVMLFLTTASAFCSTLVRKISSVMDSHQERQKETNKSTTGPDHEPLAQYSESITICVAKPDIETEC